MIYTDKEIIQGLIDRDNGVTEDFFFKRCRPLFYFIIRNVFDYEVDYDELVNELYVHLMKNDAANLRSFNYESSVFQWLKTVAIRFYLAKNSQMIEDRSKDALYEKQTENCCAPEGDIMSVNDMQTLFDKMPNKRYVFVLTRLFLDGVEPEDLAEEMNVKVSNLYNIKKRALSQLTEIALNDIREYGR